MTESELNMIKSFVDSTYNRFGQRLLVHTTDIDINDPSFTLGYCFKYVDTILNTFTYNICCSRLDIPYTDFRVMMHEYGHIYLGHLDSPYEELDQKLYEVIDQNRDDLVDMINTSCGIDFADKLLSRVIDDPVLNHTLHNIAMDMEVNSKVLCLDDIVDIENDLSSIISKEETTFLSKIANKLTDPKEKKALEDRIKKISMESKVKLVHPTYYKLGVDENGDDIPFPCNQDYLGYLVLIIQHLDQFVKMLVSIKMGGSGDTSGITSQDVKDALNNILDAIQGKSDDYKEGYRDAVNDIQSGSEGNPKEGASDDYNQGYQDGLRDMANSIDNGQGGGGMSSLDSLMEQMGMSDSKVSSSEDGNSSSSGSGDKSGDKPTTTNPGANKSKRDHSSDSRDKADVLRNNGKISSPGGLGCSSSGGSDGIREVERKVDSVDMALQEVLRNMKHRVVKVSYKKDNMKNYNRGIVRSVIAPSISRNVTISNEPKIVFLIDISGSMSTSLVNRCLSTIAASLKKLSRGLRYDIITWNTSLGEHLKDIDPRKPITKVHYGGGTDIAKGIEYFKKNYDNNSILVIISDFEDSLEDWHAVESTMGSYDLYGFNYGSYDSTKDKYVTWTNLRVRYFKNE